MRPRFAASSPRPRRTPVAVPRGFLASLLVALLAAPAAADTFVTEDGRILECKKAREEGDAYRLEFEHGSILCPKELIAEVAIEGDMSDYEPQNAREAKLLEQGKVKYRGKWMSKPAYEAELKRKNEERAERTAERALHSDWVNAWELETKHFVVKSNTSPELLEYYGELLEAYYSLMDDRLGIKPSPSLKRTKMTVNIYKSYREFQDLSPADIGPSTMGYFWSYDQTLNFFHDYQEPSKSEWVGLHECTHLLTYLIDPQFEPSHYSIWINEAVADYFGSAVISRDKKGKLVIEPGKLQTDRVLTVQQAIKDGEDTKLSELFTLERDEFDGFQYAHAWSFVYFLNQDKRYAKGFAKFFRDLYALEVDEKETFRGADKSGVAYVVPPHEVKRLLLKKIGVKDVDALEVEWKDFIANVAIDTPEARFKRAYRSLMYGIGGDKEEAKGDLDYAIEAGIQDPRAYWARGRLAFAEFDFEAAERDLRRAVELSPLDASYRFDLGQVLCGRPFAFFMAGVNLVASDDVVFLGEEEGIEEAREHLGLAMALAPDRDLYASSFEEFQDLYRKWKADQ